MGIFLYPDKKALSESLSRKFEMFSNIFSENWRCIDDIENEIDGKKLILSLVFLSDASILNNLSPRLEAIEEKNICTLYITEKDTSEKNEKSLAQSLIDKGLDKNSVLVTRDGAEILFKRIALISALYNLEQRHEKDHSNPTKYDLSADRNYIMNAYHLSMNILKIRDILREYKLNIMENCNEGSTRN